MAIFDLFSKRQKRLQGEVPDILTYDDIPGNVRIKIIHIIRDVIGENDYRRDNYRINESYNYIQKALCREYGKFSLTNNNHGPEEQVLNFLLQTKQNEEVIDVIELIFKYINENIRENYFNYKMQSTNTKSTPDEAIDELNKRFKEEGIGYGFEGGEIIKIDSTYIHTEITKPTLSLLWNKQFKGANEEYLKAHEHYRNGRNKECLTECLKAFESTLKIICNKKQWSYTPNDTARKLIQIAFNNGLVPTFTQNQFTSLQNLLESGIPTIRNKLGGHGQGHVPQKVDDEMTRYGLNLTGTNIIFLIEQSGIK
ncbi:hypothetical protein GCM10011344_33670 [Dokdonia pacifica]|uniref:Abortive infection C-terminus n=1 Tax=Dokdonia pacifica TaxID=1627892 RepID=A0A239BE03_9FLAO|nr:hypothetical protein [Dokdonia pacifica]GGG30042.1 hypothetical protein GCM10011344_33670 [Dokdonia pacifica]SNS05852.1 hypothetical protein SAMN06265376_10689 [Dokdonia pacifica]